MKSLSIITVNLNNSKGLIKTIKSVLSQTYKDFEYIIIDGGSTDESVKVIQSFTDIPQGVYHTPGSMPIGHPQLLSVPCSPSSLAFELSYWLSEPDYGVYQAMNKGIRISKGNYLLFLNSGDYLVNETVLEDVFSTSHNASFLLGRCNVSDNGFVVHTIIPPSKVTFGFLYFAGLAHQSTFIKREMFLKYGYYREDFRYNSDIEFWYRTIILNCCSTETLTTIISDYNKDGISSKESKSDGYLNELAVIYSHPMLQLFVPDYEAWKTERNKMEIFFWVKNKKILYNMVKIFYAIAVRHNKYKRK